jgi:hypothetical protein
VVDCAGQHPSASLAPGCRACSSQFCVRGSTDLSFHIENACCAWSCGVPLILSCLVCCAAGSAACAPPPPPLLAPGLRHVCAEEGRTAGGCQRRHKLLCPLQQHRAPHVCVCVRACVCVCALVWRVLGTLLPALAAWPRARAWRCETGVACSFRPGVGRTAHTPPHGMHVACGLRGRGGEHVCVCGSARRPVVTVCSLALPFLTKSLGCTWG